VYFNCFSKSDPQKITADIKSAPWWILDYCENANRMYEVFTKTIEFILKRNSTRKQARVKICEPEWITTELGTLLHEINSLKKRAISTKKESDWNQYRRLRNSLNAQKTKLKARLINEKIAASENSSKKSWAIFNDEAGRKNIIKNSILWNTME